MNHSHNRGLRQSDREPGGDHTVLSLLSGYTRKIFYRKIYNLLVVNFRVENLQCTLLKILSPTLRI